MLHEARQNESKMRRFDQLQRQLIAADSLVALIALLLSEYKQAFGVEHVTLTLVDREYEVARILECGEGVESGCSGLTLVQSTAPLEMLHSGRHEPYLGAFDGSAHQALFNASSGTIASVALLPLTRHGELIGSLHFGSANPARYVAGCGTDFLERLSEIIAICLESALSQERLKLVGLTDALTGVQNRRYFEHRYQAEVSQARRYRHALACMFLDIDKFKHINDSYGHQTGDQVLKSVANVIKAQLRVGDTIARYGGEEFVALLPQTGLHHARLIAERIRQQVAEEDFQDASGQSIRVTISIGLSMLSAKDSSAENSQLAERLIAAADRALYQAKNEGRNRVVCDGSRPMKARPNDYWGMVLRFVAWGRRLVQTAAAAMKSLMRA